MVVRPRGGPVGVPRADRTLVVGVLNVTPDSFTDGGRWLDVGAAVAHGEAMAADGADLVDVGGESTRPGGARVSGEEELRRVVPVVTALVGAGVAVSVDTMRASVARAAVDAGAVLVNDVSGGLADPRMYSLVADVGVAYVAMHTRARRAADELVRPTEPTTEGPTAPEAPSGGAAGGALGSDRGERTRPGGEARGGDQRGDGPWHAEPEDAWYDDVVAEVRGELAARVAAMRTAGIADEQVVLDPGLGFAKTGAHGWALLAGLDALLADGFPVLVGASRKRFLGALLARADGTAAPPSDRDAATAAVSALAAAAGVWAVRVHEVRSSVDAVRVAQAWRAARDDGKTR